MSGEAAPNTPQEAQAGAGAGELDLSFEEALAELTKVVEQLEQGDLTLDQALALFETGVGLARHCRRRLDEAEGKIQLLITQNDDVVLVPADEAATG
ncbi:MAG TPA: exodeoxyribonuclease VII small subunit [Sphingobacteriaceae bacterium]|nr:exodeoxyribonuclease VII small subunit [Sphingobacteriaceae bacterium]